MPGQRACLVRDALHQVAVRREKVGVVVDDRMTGAVEQRRELSLGDRHADGIPDALAEWSRRRLPTWRDPVLRVPGSTAAPLAKLLDVIEGEVVAGEVEHAVQQHAGVT